MRTLEVTSIVYLEGAYGKDSFHTPLMATRPSVCYDSRMKTCTKCGTEKSLEDFCRKKKSKDGRNTQCKKCDAERFQKYKEANPEKVRESWRKAANKRNHTRRLETYGLSHGEYDELLEKCGGKCEICREEDATCIDHDHDTGEVRGLLCNNCNTGIGMLKDSPAILESAIAYLAPKC